MSQKPKKESTVHIDYACSRCGRAVDRDDLTVKKAEFATIGERYKRIRVRTTDWLCRGCLAEDADYNLPHGHSPGYDTKRTPA